jgi:hypothetical protein
MTHETLTPDAGQRRGGFPRPAQTGQPVGAIQSDMAWSFMLASNPVASLNHTFRDLGIPILIPSEIIPLWRYNCIFLHPK